MERLFLIGATLCFLGGLGYTAFALRHQHYQPSRLNFFAMLAGFIFQTAFLAQRGHSLGRCPLTNLFEVFIFLSWSMVLFYLLVGPAYRLSLLGAFTSPLVFFLQTVALLAPIDTPVRVRLHASPWLELHAAISVMAYGAFGLACVAGVMYLAQERQLKTHQLRSIFYHLPPISSLATAINRLILTGFALLTLGLLAGLMVGRPFDWAKVALSVIVWIVYGLILQAETWKKLTPRRMAWLSVVAFSFAVSTLWGIGFISENRP